MGKTSALKPRRIPPLYLYALAALIVSLFPLAFAVAPLLGVSLLLQSQKTGKSRNFLLLQMFWLHFGLCALSFVFQGSEGPLFVFSAIGHGVLAAFYGSYSLASKRKLKPLASYLGFIGVVAVGVWTVVAVDSWILNNMLYTGIYEVLLSQAEQLKQALFENKISPYQLPGHIKLLLEQGAAVWSTELMKQLPYGLLGACVTFGYVYWVIFDFRLSKTPLYVNYKLPDGVMVVLVGCLVIWLLSYQVAEIVWVKWVSSAILTSALWIYASEGVSILLRLKVPVRRFWILFFVLTALFFYTYGTWVGLVVLGVLAQVHRFIPQKASSP